MMKRILFALSLFICTPALALAQWQTPTNSVPIGRGSGAQGFKSVGPCANGQAVIWTGGTPACGAVGSSTVPFAGVTGVPANTFLGNNTGAPANALALSGAAATAMLSPCTATAKGLVPVPPNNTTTFLRGDCTFATPAGGGGGPTVADFGAVGYAPVGIDCGPGAAAAVDDTAKLTLAANAGTLVSGVAGKCYKITSTVVGTTNNSGLTCQGFCGIYMPAASFNNTNNSAATRYGSNAVGLRFDGLYVTPFTPLKNITVRGWTIQSEVLQGRALRGIVVRNIDAARVNGNELYGFPVGVGITAAALGSLTNAASTIDGNYIHDFTDNTTGWPQAVLSQITAVELDNDIPTATMSSRNVSISSNRIADITPGAAAIAAFGNQSDGINTVAHSTSNSTYITINNNIIANTGENIDYQGKFGTISGNALSNGYIFCLKLIHGASFTAVTGNTLNSCGLAGLVVSGATNADVDGNSFTGNNISIIDPNGVWAANQSACIFTSDAGTFQPRNNIFSSNTCRPVNAKYNILRTSHGANNSFLDNMNQANGVTGLYLNTNNETGVVTIPSNTVNNTMLNAGPVGLQTYTFAQLPAGASGGSIAVITDAASCAFNTAVAGGGSATCPVYFTGAQWRGL